ncbi:hypothetical protein Pst134EB_023520 [Puccinia striiformis f. sp. tritici]|uniref:Uncharacterized protein n=2 Tax=Puccinia striiformis TaxID=27350 RepID=A0A0L0USC1_9BASI|nr:hypothetical protein Pst134EB_023520 [Puccinia striiformis f. sp. tritici]KNE89644.1 hypothetical protein PSTG_16891 [Puccinia striiformis f. sp. tritici PST-78]POW17620.1 hypothetical protein PSTT_00417 [Puccinia striiformis]
MCHCIKAEILAELMNAFQESKELIQQLDLSASKHNFATDKARTSKNIIHYLASSRQGILAATKWMKGTELDLVQLHWSKEIQGFNNTLNTLMSLISCSTRETQPAQLNDESRDQMNSKPALKLAHLCIPIMKLVRLLFKKLTTRGMNMNPFPTYTHMSSFNLDYFSDSAGRIGSDLEEFIKLLKNADLDIGIEGDIHPVESEHFIAVTSRLDHRLKNYLFFVLLYLVPIIPQSSYDFPVRDYYKDWFVLWNNSFNVAVRDFDKAAEFFDEDDQFQA